MLCLRTACRLEPSMQPPEDRQEHMVPLAALAASQTPCKGMQDDLSTELVCVQQVQAAVTLAATRRRPRKSLKGTNPARRLPSA